MASPVTMPKLGLTMNTGVVSQWRKKEGETVGKGEILMVVATDKLTFDVEAPSEGILLKVLVPEGNDVPVGEVLAYIGVSGETVAAACGKRPPPKRLKRRFLRLRPLLKKLPQAPSARRRLRAKPHARRESILRSSQVRGRRGASSGKMWTLLRRPGLFPSRRARWLRRWRRSWASTWLPCARTVA